MPLRPDTLALTITLALLTSLGPLSTDAYLPSLPAIGAFFGRPVSDVQLTLSMFLLGFAAGQIIYGPLADRHGRRPVLIGGLAVFTLASIACALAPSLDMLTGARFLQALGASGPIVLARSIVRDLYSLERAGRELARMGMIMGVVPAIAPILGGVLETFFGWRSTFWLVTAFGVAMLAIVATSLPETVREKSPHPVSLKRILITFGELGRVAGYRGYVLLASCAYAGLFAFISGSSFVLQGVYGLTPLQFGFAFGSGVIGFISGTIIAQRVVGKRGIEGTIHLGVMCLAGGGVAMLLGALIGPGHVLEVLLPITLYAAGVGLTLPQSQAGAMTPFPEKAGAASSLLGMTQMTLAAIVGIIVGKLLTGAAWPMGAALATLGLSALFVFHSTRSARVEALAKARAGGR